MRQVAADVKCYYCGHVSGQVEGYRAERLVLRAFKPRPGYQGEPPRPGEPIRCERCSGPVYLEDLRPLVADPAALIEKPAKAKRARSAPAKAA